MLGQAQHVEKLDGMFVDIRENDLGSIPRRDIDHPEKNGDADAIDDLGLREIYDHAPVSVVESAAALVLDPFTRKFLEIIAREDLVNVSRGYRCSFCDHLNTACCST